MYTKTRNGDVYLKFSYQTTTEERKKYPPRVSTTKSS